MREADLRRHLVNEAGVEDEVIQEDGRPDPRFASTAAQLEQRGIEDYQLHYALQTIARLGRVRTAARGAAGRHLGRVSRMPASSARRARAGSPLGPAKALSLLVPAALLAGAYGFEHIGGLFPCEMCWWQRWAHMAALGFALVAFARRGGCPIAAAASSGSPRWRSSPAA